MKKEQKEFLKYFTIAILIPIVVFLIIVFAFHSRNSSFLSALKYVLNNKSMLPGIIMLSMMVDSCIFLIYYKLYDLVTARAFVLASILYVCVALVLMNF